MQEKESIFGNRCTPEKKRVHKQGDVIMEKGNLLWEKYKEAFEYVNLNTVDKALLCPICVEPCWDPVDER
jgi:hypothetical protein